MCANCQQDAVAAGYYRFAVVVSRTQLLLISYMIVNGQQDVVAAGYVFGNCQQDAVAAGGHMVVTCLQRTAGRSRR